MDAYGAAFGVSHKPIDELTPVTVSLFAEAVQAAEKYGTLPYLIFKLENEGAAPD